MKVKNTSKKLIHIGSTPLMPGEETVVANTIAETPAIQILVKHGLLELTAEKKAQPKPKEETPAVTVAEVTEAEPPKADPPKTTTQRGNKSAK